MAHTAERLESYMHMLLELDGQTHFRIVEIPEKRAI